MGKSKENATEPPVTLVVGGGQNNKRKKTDKIER